MFFRVQSSNFALMALFDIANDEGEITMISSSEDVPVPWDVDPWWRQYKHEAMQAFSQLHNNLVEGSDRASTMLSGSGGETVFVFVPQHQPTFCDTFFLLFLMFILFKMICTPRPARIITLTDEHSDKKIEV